MENLKPWYGMLRRINTAIEDISKIDRSSKREDMVKILEVRTAEVIQKGKGIQPVQETKEEQVGIEMEEIKNSMIEIEYPQYKEAKAEVIRTLKTLASMNLGLSSTQIKQVENILRIILTICIEYHLEIHNNHLTMTSMIKLIVELLTLSHKLESAEKAGKNWKQRKRS